MSRPRTLPPPAGTFAHHLYRVLESDRYGQWTEVFESDLLAAMCERIGIEADVFYEEQRRGLEEDLESVQDELQDLQGLLKAKGVRLALRP